MLESRRPDGYPANIRGIRTMIRRLRSKTNVVAIVCLLATISIAIPSSMTAAAGDSEDSKVIVLTDGSQPQPGGKEVSGVEPSDSSGNPFSWSWDVTLASQYVWQGFRYSQINPDDEPHSQGKPVVQPEISLGYDGLSVTAWINHDLHQRHTNEFDLYLQYDQEWHGLTISPGWAYFDYPNRDWAAAHEIYVNIAFDAPWNPTLSLHYDYDTGQGFYESLGLGHDFETPLGIWAFESTVYVNSSYYDVSGIPSVEFKGSHGFTYGSWSLTPSVSYFLTWDNGDFQDDLAIPDTWLFTLNIAQAQ